MIIVTANMWDVHVLKVCCFCGTADIYIDNYSANVIAVKYRSSSSNWIISVKFIHYDLYTLSVIPTIMPNSKWPVSA